jgi:hypothetical protein
MHVFDYYTHKGQVYQVTGRPMVRIYGEWVSGVTYRTTDPKVDKLFCRTAKDFEKNFVKIEKDK